MRISITTLRHPPPDLFQQGDGDPRGENEWRIPSAGLKPIVVCRNDKTKKTCPAKAEQALYNNI